MTAQSQSLFRGPDPLQALLTAPGDSVLVIIAGTEGPSYRSVGAMMAVLSSDRIVGTVSSGCIEADIAVQARQALRTQGPTLLRYGRGSPFKDIELPCGGGLDVLLVPRPDRQVLRHVVTLRSRRTACTLTVDCETGAVACVDTGDTGRQGATLRIRFEPELRFVICGKGPEASTFAALVHAAGYPHVVLSPDDETRDAAALRGSDTRALPAPALPTDIVIDSRTAVTLFFHDHDWEPPILADVLRTQAFYIGAQGSQRARDARFAALRAAGVDEPALARLSGPVGLIPSARDPGTLAVSVLAEVLATAKIPCV